MREDKSGVEFKQYVRAANQEIENPLTPCPSDEELFEYHAGNRDRGQHEAIQAHIVSCGTCRQALLDAAALVESDARDVDKSDWERFRCALEPSLAARKRTRAFRALAALAALLAITTALGFAWAFKFNRQALAAQTARRMTETQQHYLEVEIAKLERPKDTIPALAVPLTDLQLHDLLPSGSVSRSGEDHLARAIRATPGRAVLLVLNAAGQPEYSNYGMEILDSLSRPVWKKEGVRRDSQQNYIVLIPAGFLNSGDYRIRILGLNGRSRELADYRFRLVISP